MPEKFKRDKFSIGGNDSDKYAENYEKIFGHEDPLPKEEKKKKEEKQPMSPIVKVH